MKGLGRPIAYAVSGFPPCGREPRIQLLRQSREALCVTPRACYNSFVMVPCTFCAMPTSNPRFCSRQCAGRFGAKLPRMMTNYPCRYCARDVQTIVNNPHPVCIECRTMTCEQCGQPFEVPQRRQQHSYKGTARQRRFCSLKCAGKVNGPLAPRGPDSPHWKGGKSGGGGETKWAQ